SRSSTPSRRRVRATSANCSSRAIRGPSSSGAAAMICPYCAFDNIEGVDRCENCGHDLGGLDLPDGAGAERGLEFIYQRLADLPAKRPSEVEVTDPVYLAVRIMQNEDTGCV